ncbi:MAG: hypothetical protein ACKVZJ_06965 [Phycisphaerales bacterium]
MLKLFAILMLSVSTFAAPDATVDLTDPTPAPAALAAAAPSSAVEETTQPTTEPPAESTTDSLARALSGAGVNPFKSMQDRLNGKWDFLVDPKSLNDVLSQVHIVWACIFIIVGALCVLNGYRWHKGVILLLAAIMGLYAGTMLGERIGGTNVVAACMAVLFAVAAWPMLRFAVALFGGLAGAFAGANIWTALEFPTAQHQYGAVIGLVVVGMLAFMAFRAVVILLTSIGGASMLVLGFMAALMQVESWQGGMSDAMNSNRLIVPIITASVAIIGAIYQFGGGVSGLNAMASKADPAAKKKQAA